VWTGATAKQLGLVDEIGGLDAALAEARRLAKVDPATGLEIYPPQPTLRDLIVGFGQVHAPLGISGGSDVFVVGAAALATLQSIDPRVAAATEHLVRLALSFQSQAVQAVAILPVLP